MSHLYYYEKELEINYEVPYDEFSESEKENKAFVDKLSEVVQAAHCGWDKVEYVLASTKYRRREPFMVLYSDVFRERLIPLDICSKGYMLALLGESLL